MPKVRKQKKVETATTRTRYQKSGAKPLKWMPSIADTERPLTKEDSVRYLRKTQPENFDEKDSKSQEESTESPATRNRYRLEGGKPLHWLKNIEETSKPLSKEGSLRYIQEKKSISQNDTLTYNDSAKLEKNTESPITRNSYAKTGGKPLKWMKNINEVERPLSKEGSIRYENELLQSENNSELENLNKKRSTVNFSQKDNEETSTAPKRRSQRNKDKTKTIDIDKVPITRNMGAKLREEQPTRNRYKLGRGASLKWLRNISETDRPLTKVGSVRYELEKAQQSKGKKETGIKKRSGPQSKTVIKKTKLDNTESENKVSGSRVTRNRYLMAGEKELKWIKNMNEVDRPLSKEDSVRYQNEVANEKILPPLRYKNKLKINKTKPKSKKLQGQVHILKQQKLATKDSELTPDEEEDRENVQVDEEKTESENLNPSDSEAVNTEDLSEEQECVGDLSDKEEVNNDKNHTTEEDLNLSSIEK